MVSHQKMIYAIGDSHCLFWDGWNGVNLKYSPPVENNIFIPFHLGPVLAYSLSKFGTRTRGREKFDDLVTQNIFPTPEGFTKPIVMTCFGEIDIRAHLLASGAEKATSRLMQSLNNYMEFIDFYSDSFDFIIYGPIATQKDAWYMNPRFPRFGTERERNELTREYNARLREECAKREILFFTLFDELIDSNLNTRAECIIDECHISNAFYAPFVDLFKKAFNNFYPQLTI